MRKCVPVRSCWLFEPVTRSREIVITVRLVMSAMSSELSRLMIDEGKMSRHARSFRKSDVTADSSSLLLDLSYSEPRVYNEVVQVEIDLDLKKQQQQQQKRERI